MTITIEDRKRLKRRSYGTARIAEICRVRQKMVQGWIRDGRLLADVRDTKPKLCSPETLAKFLREHEIPLPPELQSELPRQDDRLV